MEQDFGWNNEYMNFINGTAGKRNKCKEDDHTINSLPLISGEQS